MKSLIVVLILLVSILGVISNDLSSTGKGVQFEEPEMLADGSIFDLGTDRKGKLSKPVCRKWKSCCQKYKDQEKHYGLVVTGGDNPNRIAVSNQISSMGVCGSPNIPNLPVATAGAKSVWIEDSKTLMFCGGSHTFEGHEIQYPNGWGAMDTCLKLKPGEDNWKPNTDYNMKIKRSWFSLNKINTKQAVAAGGMTPGYGNITDSIEKYSNGKWEILRNKKGEEIKLDKETYGHCAVQYNKGKYPFLMIIGGSNNPTNFSDATSAVTVYNLKTGASIPITDIGELPPVWAPACAIKGDDIYVTGGGNAGETYYKVYKGSKDGGFKEIGSGLNAFRSGHTMGVTSNGQLIVAGGYNPVYGSPYLKQIESSEDDGETWNTWPTTLTEGGEYAALATVPAFTFTCAGEPIQV